MKTKHLTLMVVMLASCMAAKAQEQVTNYFVSYAPFGGASPSFNSSPDKFGYTFKNFWNASLGVDVRLGDYTSVLLSLEYGQGKYKSHEFKGTPVGFDATIPDKLSMFSFNGLCGGHLLFGNPKSSNYGRVEIAGYIGPGFSYMKGGPFHHWTLSPTAKVRLKTYVGSKWGLFIGASARYHFGFKNMFSENDDRYLITGPQWNAEIGFVHAIASM